MTTVTGNTGNFTNISLLDNSTNYLTCSKNADWAANQTSQAPTPIFDAALRVSNVIIPVELTVGFALQILNLAVLSGHRIRSLTYTVYLKALSLTYISSIPFFIPNLLKKRELLSTTIWPVVAYSAHLEAYLINLFLFSGNLIVLALAVEPLRSIINPLTTLTHTSKRPIVVVILIYTFMGLILLPLVASQRVVTRKNGHLCVERVKGAWLSGFLLYAIPAVFELGLVLCITVVYTILMIRFYGIIGEHRESVRRHTSTANRNLLGSHARALSLAVSSVTAYLISNSLSCIKEIIKLCDHLFEFQVVKTEWYKVVFIICVNIALLFNFTLCFLLHYAFSSQYRAQLHFVLRHPVVWLCPGTDNARLQPRASQARSSLSAHSSNTLANQPR